MNIPLSRREQASLVKRRVYMDHNASSPPLAEAVEAAMPWLQGRFGNASSIHWAGRAARAAVDDARAAVARLVGASPSEVIFTSGGSEADNLALFGVFLQARREDRRHVVVSDIEHPAVLRAAEALEAEGAEITRVAVTPSGTVRVEDVLAAVRGDTCLVSLMLANNETGLIQPVAAVAEALRPRGVPVHTDAVQAAGRIPVSMGHLGVDLLSLSGHKLGAFQGVGALICRRGVKLTPRVFGGNHERSRRAGTENVPGIVSLGAAATACLRDLDEYGARVRALRDALERDLLERIPGAAVNGDGERLPNTLNLAFEDVEGEALLLNLDLEGIAASSGSACASGTMKPSHVLLAMGLCAARAHGSLRLSLGPGSEPEDIATVAEILPPIVARLRSQASVQRPRRRAGGRGVR